MHHDRAHPAAGHSRLCRARLRAVFPLWPRSKEPACKHGFKNATRNPAVIKRYWLAQPELQYRNRDGDRYRVSGCSIVDGSDGEDTLGRS